MATAKKLPSGQYRVRAYVGKDQNGKDIRKSFTAPSKKQAEYLATQYVLNYKPADGESMSFGAALDRYIAGRESVLSPSTIREYKRMRNNNFSDLVDLSLANIDQDTIQAFVNKRCELGDQPKYVRNMHGLISAVLNQYRPDLRLRTSLPAKKKPDLYLPSDEEVIKTIEYIRSVGDHELLLAILLAAYGPMRRSEVCAITHDDINGNVIHVHRAKVDAGDKWVIKDTPKTVAGNRFIPYPDFIIKEIPPGDGFIVSILPDNITARFAKALKRAGIHHYRYHDLRHYSASVQHALGIPDAYIMQRGGWESDATLKQIYRHAMDKEAQEANDKINNYFAGLQKTGHEIGHE